MEQQNIQVVEAFLNALKNKDLSGVPAAADIYFEEPLSGSGKGIEDLRAFVSGFLPALSDVRIIQHIADGEFVVTLWEADGVFGRIRILEKFRVTGGLVKEFYAFYDPRPITG